MSNPTLLVSSFNNSLALTDASGPDVWTGVDPVRYDGGLWNEVATANLCVNPSAETNRTSITAYGGTSVARVSTQAYSGTYSCEATHAGSSGTGVQFTTSTGLGGSARTFRASGYLRLNTGASEVRWRLVFAYTDASSETTNGSNFTINNSGWVRQTVTATTNAGKTLDSIQFIALVFGAQTAGSFFADAVQIEEKTYATSYADGSLGDGYAWSGTAHASTSTRAASSASADPTSRISASSGAIALRYTRKIDTAAEEIILTCGNKASSEDYLEIGVDSSDDLYMEWDSNNAGAQRVTIATTVAVDTEYFYYFDWDGTTIRASIDNGLLSSDTRAAVEGDLTGGDLTISAAVGSHVIGPFAVFDRPLTTKEITTLYQRETWGFNTLASGSRANIFQLRPKAVT